MIKTLFDLAMFDKNLLNIYITKQIYPEIKHKTNLSYKSNLCKAIFLKEYKNFTKLEKSKNLKIALTDDDKELIPVLDRITKVDKALPVLFLYLREMQPERTHSAYTTAERCKVSHNRIQKLVGLLEAEGLVSISNMERSFFEVDLKLGKTTAEKPISVSDVSLVDFETIRNEIDLLASEHQSHIETQVQITEIKGLINCVDTNQNKLDRNSLQILSNYIKNKYYILINNIKYICKATMDLFLPSEPTKQSKFILSREEEVGWARNLFHQSRRFFSTHWSERDIIQVKGDPIMKENVLYICNSWNKFADGPNRNVKKFRVPKKYAKTGIFPDTDNLLNAINSWIQENDEDWKEMWDDFIKYCENNQVMKGTFRQKGWEPSLSWVFSIHEKRGLNLLHVLNTGYDFAKEPEKIGEMKELKQAAADYKKENPDYKGGEVVIKLPNDRKRYIDGDFVFEGPDWEALAAKNGYKANA